MKFYSELTKTFFDSEIECLEAEKEYQIKLDEAELKRKQKAEQKKVRMKEIEEAYNKVSEANKAYNDLLDAFFKDYVDSDAERHTDNIIRSFLNLYF